jgi:hypothetical protein
VGWLARDVALGVVVDESCSGAVDVGSVADGLAVVGSVPGDAASALAVPEVSWCGFGECACGADDFVVVESASDDAFWSGPLPSAGFLGPASEFVDEVSEDAEWPVSAHATPCPPAAAIPMQTATTARRDRGDHLPECAPRSSCTVIDVPFDIRSWCADSLPKTAGPADAYTTPDRV